MMTAVEPSADAGRAYSNRSVKPIEDPRQVVPRKAARKWVVAACAAAALLASGLIFYLGLGGRPGMLRAVHANPEQLDRSRLILIAKDLRSALERNSEATVDEVVAASSAGVSGAYATLRDTVAIVVNRDRAAWKNFEKTESSESEAVLYMHRQRLRSDAKNHVTIVLSTGGEIEGDFTLAELDALLPWRKNGVWWSKQQDLPWSF